MELGASLQQALERVVATGRVEVRENGTWLACLDNFQYEIYPDNGEALLHLWSAQRNQFCRVIRILQEDPDRLVVEVKRFGRARPVKLEFIAARKDPAAARLTREQFRTRFRDFLCEQFPDETVTSLSAAPDLEHSLSGSYVRGLTRSGSQDWAVLAAAPDEGTAVCDGLLTFGLLWLHRARHLASSGPVAGLRLFFPPGMGQATAHRVAALAPDVAVKLYEYVPETGRAREVDPLDAGNVQSWLVPRRETENLLSAADPFLKPLLSRSPGAIQPHIVPGANYVEVRYRGLAFARWQADGVLFGLGDNLKLLTPARQQAFDKLLNDFDTHRSPLASSTTHRLFRAQPERWLESLIAADPSRVDAHLDTRFIYAQVPAVSIGDRGIMDLVGVTRDGRLTILELKAQEDIHMPLQAVDYWLRVRWHHSREDFSRYGYFPGVTLDPRPPRLLLIAPSLRFHPATDVILRSLHPQIEIERIGLSESWRRGLKVVLRQGRDRTPGALSVPKKV
jgi:hypothetical protein